MVLYSDRTDFLKSTTTKSTRMPQNRILQPKIQFGYTSFSHTANVCDNTITTKLASHRNMRAVHVQKSELSWLSANSTRHPPNWPAVDLGLDAIC